jgi:hypothetical protein
MKHVIYLQNAMVRLAFSWIVLSVYGSFRLESQADDSTGLGFEESNFIPMAPVGMALIKALSSGGCLSGLELAILCL